MQFLLHVSSIQKLTIHSSPFHVRIRYGNKSVATAFKETSMEKGKMGGLGERGKIKTERNIRKRRLKYGKDELEGKKRARIWARERLLRESDMNTCIRVGSYTRSARDWCE